MLGPALGLGALYAAITDEPINTPWFLAVIVAAIPLAVSALLPWGRLVQSRVGSWLMLLRSSLLALIVSAAVAATGGAESQLWVLYALIALFVGWCFDEVTEIAFSVAMAGLYLGMLAVAGGLPARGPLFARLVCLGLVASGISILARESRAQAEMAIVAAREAAALAEARRGVAEQAQRLNRLQSEFVSTVSHELRTPLTAIIGNLVTLQRGIVSDPVMARTLVEGATRHAERLNALINDLLTASRVDEGEMKLHTEEVDVSQVAADVVAELRVARPGGLIAVVTETPASLLVWTDRNHLHRVLVNLAENGLKYGRGARVSVRLARVGSRVRLVVEDSGPGIEPGNQSRIFERFAQIDGSERREVGGTGLGLHICSRLVELLGGHLMVSSLPGQGAAFGFTLPAPGVAASTASRTSGQEGGQFGAQETAEPTAPTRVRQQGGLEVA